ncbi:MAG: hypothetical protein FWD26_06295, partial [Treponema sp.]|nr:hypothetical protein [Treponema sp.]
MKKYFFFLVFFIFLNFFVWGAEFVWTGDVDDDWFDPDNWLEGGNPAVSVPVDGDDIIIPVSGNYPTVPDTIDFLGNVSIQGGTLSVEAGSTLTITGNLDISGGVITGGTVNFWGGTVTSSAPDVNITGVSGTTSVLTAGSKNIFVSTDSAAASISIDVDAMSTSAERNLTVNGTRALVVSGSAVTLDNLTIAGDITTGGNLYAEAVAVNNNLLLNASVSGIGTLTNNGTLVLGTSLTIDGALVSSGIIDGDGNDLTITGSAELNGTSSGIGALVLNADASFLSGTLNADSVNVTGISTIGANITTTAEQTYNAVTLSGTSILEGTIVTFGVIAGGGNDLTINGTAELNGTSSSLGTLTVNGDAFFETANLEAVSVNVTSTSDISVNIITTAGQTYDGVVTLTGTRTLEGSLVNLGLLEGNDLTITGSAILNGTSSAIGALVVTENASFLTADVAAASVDVTGTSAIGVDITTTAGQVYSGAVTLTGTRTLEGTLVSLGVIDGDGNDLTITGSAELNGTSSGIGALVVTADAFFLSGTLNADSVNVIGISTIGANVTTTQEQTYNGAVTLSGTSILEGATVTL